MVPSLRFHHQDPILHIYIYIYTYTGWFKYNRYCLCVNLATSVPVIFEPPCIYIYIYTYLYTRYTLQLEITRLREVLSVPLIWGSLIHIKLLSMSSLHTGRLYPQEIFLILISVQVCVHTEAIVWPEGLKQWKIIMTWLGIEPATSWVVAPPSQLWSSCGIMCYIKSMERKARLKCDGTCAETRFGFTAKRTNPFKSAGGHQFSRLLAAEVCASAVVMLDTPCSEVECKTTGYPLHSHVSPSLPLPCVTVCHQVSSEL